MPRKLLLADDSVTIQRVIELTFADEDIRVVAVGDGQQAIERIEADPPDIILADVDMPKRDGYEVASYVKGRPALRHIPVVLLTGAFEPVDRARAAAVGSDDVLAKPFEPQMVINRVKQLLGSSTKGAVPAVAVPPARVAAGARQEVTDPARVAPGASAPAVTRENASAREPSAGRTASTTVEVSGSESPQVSLDEYFDQLDAAFSQMRPGHAADLGAASAAEEPAAEEGLQWGVPLQPPVETSADEWALPDLTGQTPANVLDSLDFQQPPVPAAPLATEPAPRGPSRADASAVSESFAPAEPGAQPFAQPAPQPTAQPAPVQAVGAAPQAPVQPPVADAFAALLAAEQGQPSSLPFVFSARAASTDFSDGQIDEIVNRVLERLTDRNARDLIVDTVSRIAEKLVREEIEQIKARAK
jgi:CheY-like chemotaxis protein